jgi:hypothetical protein
MYLDKESLIKTLTHLVELQEKLKCCKCGFDHPAALELHYLKNKGEHCLVCSNCHKILHYEIEEGFDCI